MSTATITQWKEKTLGELVESGEYEIRNNLRQPLSSAQRSKMQGQYQYYGAAGAIDSINDYRFEGLHLLVAEDGTVFDGTSPMLQLVSGKFWVSNHAHVLRGKNEAATRRLYYFLRNVNASPYVTGAVQPKLSKENLFRISFSYPETDEEKINAVATPIILDSKIELLRKQNETLEQIAQAIFKEWFAAPSEALAKEGKLPKGWRVGKIKDLINIFSGFAFSSSDFSQTGKYKLVTIKNVQDRHFNQEIKDTLDDLPSKMPSYCNLKTGDVLLSLTGNVGRICLVVGENYLLNQRVAKLEPTNAKDYAFSYLLFLQNSIFSILQSTASGTAQQNLSPVQTKEIEIVIPQRKILDNFGNLANPMIQKINFHNSQIQTLSKLRDTLLPKLMKGEIRVKS